MNGHGPKAEARGKGCPGAEGLTGEGGEEIRRNEEIEKQYLMRG